jgi:general secretion pathway protein L
MPIGDVAARAWSWWTGELAAMLPRFLADGLTSTSRRRVCLSIDAHHAVIGPIEPRADRFRPLSRRFAPAAARPMPATIRLHPALVFETTLQLPLAAEASLRAVLAHHLGLVVPLEPVDMAFDHVVIARDQITQTLRVAVAVTRRATLERAGDAARRLGLLPDRATVDRAGADDSPFDFLRAEAQEAANPRRGRRLRWLEVIAGLLVIAACVVHFADAEMARSRRAEAIEQLRQPAEAAARLRQNVQTLQEPLDFLAGVLSAPSRLATLDALSRELPDDTWLTQLRLHGREVEMNGSSPDSARLIARFAGAASAFETPRFRAPITTGPDGRERFDLTLGTAGR